MDNFKMFARVMVFCINFSCLSSVLFAQRIETVIQQGHNAAVTSLATDTSGTYLVTGSKDHTAKLWNVKLGKEVRTFLGHEKSVTSVDITQNGKYIATSGYEGTVKVWEASTGKLLFDPAPYKESMGRVKFSPDGRYLLAGGYLDSVMVLDWVEDKQIASFSVNPDKGLGHGITIGFSNTGRWLAIGEDNKMVKLIDVQDWSIKKEFPIREGYCGGCAAFTTFSPDDKYLLRFSERGSIEEYEVESGKLVRAFGEKEGDIKGVVYIGDSIIVSTKKELIIYSRDGLELNKVEVAAKGKVTAIHLRHKYLFLASEDNKVTSYRISSLSISGVFEGLYNHSDKGNLSYDINNYWESHIARYIKFKNEVLVTDNSRSIMKGKTGTEVKLWDIATGLAVKDFVGHNTAVICFDKSADEKLFLTGDGEGKAKVWTSSGEMLYELNGHRDPLLSVKFSPDETEIAISSWDARVSLWDARSGKRNNLIDLKSGSAYSLSYTPDGLYLILGRLGKTLEMWETDTRSIVRNFIGHTDVVSCIQFHPQQKNVMLTSSWDGSVRVWDIHTGLMLKKFITGSPVHACLFTANGKHVIAAGNDRKIRIWDMESSNVIHELDGHSSEISNLSLSHDGKMLVSSSVDGVIKFWNMDTKKEFYEHYTIGKSDWMVRTKEGYFNGTLGAMDYVHFVKGNEVIKAEQIFEKFYKPNLLPDLFKKQGTTGQIKSIEDIYKKSPPPVLKITYVLEKGEGEVVLFIKVTDLGGGVDEVKLTQNGKRLDVPGFKSFGKKGESILIEQPVKLVRGVNIFDISGFSRERLESAPLSVEVFSDEGEYTSVCHVFAIGIDKYVNPSMELTYAKNDAKAFGELVMEKGKSIYKDVKLYALYNEQAEKSRILEVLDELSTQVRKNDVFIFYYAGHGTIYEDDFYFIPVGCLRLHDGQSLAKGGIKASDIQEKLKTIEALKQIIIMDACHAGGSVETFASRGSVQERAISQLSRSAGIHVLASAGGEQTAKEVMELEHGIFTYLLLKGLNGEADGSPKDGKITVFELKSYLDDKTPELNRQYSGKPQYPYTFSQGQDFPVVIIGE